MPQRFVHVKEADCKVKFMQCQVVTGRLDYMHAK